MRVNAGMILVQRLSSIEDPRVTGRCDPRQCHAPAPSGCQSGRAAQAGNEYLPARHEEQQTEPAAQAQEGRLAAGLPVRLARLTAVSTILMLLPWQLS